MSIWPNIEGDIGGNLRFRKLEKKIYIYSYQTKITISERNKWEIMKEETRKQTMTKRNGKMK